MVGDATVKDFKKILTDKMAKLNDRLDVYLGKLYGKDPKRVEDYKAWHDSHKPFHWFAEFYDIIHDHGGFDVIIGNPPNVELKVANTYTTIGYKCIDSSNLYVLVMERCFGISAHTGRQGYIVPVSSISTERYESLQKLISSRSLYYCSFYDRPSRLFDGLEHIRLTIHILCPSTADTPSLYSERFNKWFSLERPVLFNRLQHTKSTVFANKTSLPKLHSVFENSIINKLENQKKILSHYFVKNSSHKISYSRKIDYFLQVLDFEPEVYDGNGNRRHSSEYKSICFDKMEYGKLALCCLNSNLFYWFVTVLSDCRHVTKREIDCFYINLELLSKSEYGNILLQLSVELMDSIKGQSEIRQMKFAHDTLNVQCIYPQKSKPIIDKIDTILAKHYGFTDEELDFIINYDIKYRMGKGAGEVDGDE